jgi:flagellar biosynthesis/type III secretory pathway M-ring protein FliF/YscJ
MTDTQPIPAVVSWMSFFTKEKMRWPVMLGVLGLLVLVICVLGIRFALIRRKYAQLASQLRQSEEARKRAEEQIPLVTNDLEREEAKKKAAELKDQATTLAQELEVNRVKHDELAKVIQTATSWDDLQVVDSRP